MPRIISTATIDFPFKAPQSKIKKFARDLFSKSFPDIDRLMPAYDNTEIEERNFCVPLSFFESDGSFERRNNKFIEEALKGSISVIEKCLEETGITKDKITDLIFVTTTGLSTPSIDAMIVNEMKLDQNINRLPIWGLGCAGGVSGIAKANMIAKANPDAIVIVVSSELCCLTFIKNDFSKSNFIATGLFSDGIAAIVVTGDNVKINSDNNLKIKIHSSRSKLYYNSLDVMGWEILDSGFKVVFSRDIPNIVHENVKEDILSYLDKYSIPIDDVKNFITHPGGAKVISAYIDALKIEPELLHNTREVLKRYGNMSSATVLYVMKEFMDNGFEEGYGLMMALGPGFSSEMVLLEIEK
jgi:alkylresorcinol/alkylpyrone synthase